MHSPGMSEQSGRRLRSVLVIGCVSLATCLGILCPATAQAKLRKKSTLRTTNDRHASKKHQHATQAHHHKHKLAHTAHPSRRRVVAHAGRHHHSQQFVRRHRDPGQLTIAQGDGSPLLAVAARFLGDPYRFGAEDDGAFDCSGFVRHVFASMGVELPHSAREQYTLGDGISRDELEPGDLVFFHTSRRYASHVGIYVGDDMFVHAASHGGQVQVDSLNKPYYAQHYLGARRIDI